MVLEKPAGMAVHPTRGEVRGTLANAFCGLLRARGQKGVFRPINRLDKGTSGLVLCAMNAYAAPLLAKSAQKVYYALCGGTPPAKAGEFCGPIARRGDSILGRCVCPQGKPASTRYCVLAAGQGRFLAACALGTGRTHQIRVHFSHAGCRFWATGCTAVMHRRWGGPPFTAACCALQRPRAGLRAPAAVPGVCAAAAGYGRPGLPACARRRAAGQAWCGACICAPRVALKCEKGYNILVTFQAMPAIALRKAGRKGGGGNGAKA